MDDSRREQLEAEKKAMIERLKKKILFSNVGYIIIIIFILLALFTKGPFWIGLIGLPLNYFWNKELQKKLTQVEQQKI